MQLLYMAARLLGVHLNMPSLSAKHVLAAQYETPPQNPPSTLFLCLSPFMTISQEKWAKEGKERGSAPSAFVASTLSWLWFPPFQWKNKVLLGEALGWKWELRLVLQIFFQWPLIKKGEDQVVQTDPERLRMSNCWWLIAGVPSIAHLCVTHASSNNTINQHHLDKALTELEEGWGIFVVWL